MSIRPPQSYLDRIATTLPPAVTEAEEPPSYEIGDKVEIIYETFSPVEEYRAREGRTEPLDEEFQALLAYDYRGAGTVTANGILIKDSRLVGVARREEGVTYWHPDSNLCNRVAEGPVKVNYTFNPARPDIVHLWDEHWRYLETLPARYRVPILDRAALAEAAKEAKRQIKKFTDQAQLLHTGDTARELDRLSHNAAAMGHAAIALNLPGDLVPKDNQGEPAKRGSHKEGFQASERDTEVILEQARHTRQLIDDADADLAALQHHRRSTAPVLAKAYDPLDDL